MTNDTTFVGTVDGVTTDNLLKPANGEIFLLHRDDNNFIASQSDITNNLLTELNGVSAVANIFGADVTGPTMSSLVRVTNTIFTLTLSETMDAASVTKANNGGFSMFETGTPGTTYAISSIAPGITANKITITVADTGVSAAKGITVIYTAGGNGTVKDVAGNALATDAVGVSAIAWDTTPPTLQSVSFDTSTQIAVTLSEPADVATITKANDGGFVVYETGTPATTYAVSAIQSGSVDNNIIYLTVADIALSGAIGITVTYVAGGNGTVSDVAGNTMITDAVGVLLPAWA